MSTIEEKIKDFLYIFPYKVMYEKHISEDKDVFFCVISKNDIKDPYIIEFLNTYEESFPLSSILSPLTVKFMEMNKNSDYFIWVDSLEHNTNFFMEKKEHIMKNANNIISIRTTGEPSDKFEHIEHVTQKNLKKLKILSTSIFEVLKESAEDKLEEFKPKIKKNVKAIKKKIVN